MSKKFLTPLVLPANPTQPLEATPKQYVDSLAGTKILSGTGAPAAVTGAPGNYYLDTVTDTLYGPKASGEVPFYYEFPAHSAEPAGNYTLGIKFRVTEDNCRCDGVRHHAGTVNPSSTGWKIRLYRVSDSVLLAVATVNVVLDQWQVSYFDTPVALTKDVDYMVSLWSGPVGWYKQYAPWTGPGITGPLRIHSQTDSDVYSLDPGSYGAGDIQPTALWANTVSTFSPYIVQTAPNPWPVAIPPAPPPIDEVFVGPGDPGLGYEMWYDTDAPTPTLSTANPQNALGLVASTPGIGQVSCPQGTLTQVTGNIAFTMLVGRRYRFVYYCRAIGPSVQSADTGIAFGLYDGAVGLGWIDHWQTGRNNYFSTYAAAILDGDGVARSFNVRGSTQSAGSLLLHHNAYSPFYIEDIGPNSSPALPVPATPPAWTTVTLTGSWVEMAGGRSPTSYRKIGDIVYLRIAAKNGANASSIFTLPVGFRPPATLDVMGRDGAGAGVFNVNPDGTVVWYGTNSTIGSLNTLFSVTA